MLIACTSSLRTSCGRMIVDSRRRVDGRRRQAAVVRRLLFLAVLVAAASVARVRPALKRVTAIDTIESARPAAFAARGQTGGGNNATRTTEKRIRFIAISGLYHTGSKAMWNSIRSNEGVAAERGIELRAYGGSDSGGYPPCGVRLTSDGTVDEAPYSPGGGSLYPGLRGNNARLYGEFGAVWADYHADGPRTVPAVMKLGPRSELEHVYTAWKHTPPTHPMLACHRPDTLYVVVTRHPATWAAVTAKKPYDLKFQKGLKQWRLVRTNPRRLPPFEMRFRTLYDAWAYYHAGYLEWEAESAGRSCYRHSPGDSPDDGTNHTAANRENCLGGPNRIPEGRRNVLLVRYEDYLVDPKKVLSNIFSFATAGVIDPAADADRFVPHDEGGLVGRAAVLAGSKSRGFFQDTERYQDSGAKVLEVCERLGYSCRGETDGYFLTT